MLTLISFFTSIEHCTAVVTSKQYATCAVLLSIHDQGCAGWLMTGTRRFHE